MKRTRLKPQSAERRREQAVRRKAMRAAFGPSPQCRFPGCWADADDAHEPGMRARGADPTNPEHCIPICRPHHDWVHANVAKATEMGLLIPSWVSDKTPHV